MAGSKDPGVTIVNPTKISVMYGYVTLRMTSEIVVMYNSKGVKIIENIDCKYYSILLYVKWLSVTLMFSSYHGQNHEIQYIKETPLDEIFSMLSLLKI